MNYYDIQKGVRHIVNMKMIKKTASFIISYMFFGKVRIRSKVNLLLFMKKRRIMKIFRIIIQEQLRRKCHIIIAENSIIGSIVLPHPHNIVIGRETIIGKNCIIYHDVTIGQNKNLFPKIGDNVIIYPGAKVIGGISIGDNVVIGANAVVTTNVPDNAIIGGIPAKIIRYRVAQDVFS